jgi:hypothetical protein
MQHDVVSVVGGGYSFKAIDRDTIPGKIIAVNDAAVHLERYDYALSMDRLWVENRMPQLVERARPAYLRRAAVKHVNTSHAWCHVFENDYETVRFSRTPDRLNGTNSGACALNLAYIMKPKELYLFGFDMCKGPNEEPYWYAPYPWAAPQGATKPGKYKSWVEEFDEIAAQFASIGTRVVNVSSRSRIKQFVRIDKLGN